jgi:hypothetical protein
LLIVRSLEEAQKVANAAIKEENRIEFLLNANAQRKLLLERLSTLRDVWKEDLCCKESDFTSDSPDFQQQTLSQGSKIPIVLRVKSMAEQPGKLEETISVDSECNPPSVDDPSHSQANYTRVETCTVASQELIHSKAELGEKKLETGPDPDAVAQVTASNDCSAVHNKQDITSTGANWSTFHSAQEGDGDGLISCQLSTDGSVDLMSTLSVTEGVVSLSSSMTSTNSSYTPRRHRLLGETAKARRHYATDLNGYPKGLDRRKFSSVAASLMADKVERQGFGIHQESMILVQNQSEVDLASKYPAYSVRLSEPSDCVALGGLMPCDSELAPLRMNIDDVQILYERAMTAEYENKRLRKKIESLERECTFLRSSTNMAAKGVLEVLPDFDDTEVSKSLCAELKYADNSQLVRFSRSPYILQEGRRGSHLSDDQADFNSRVQDMEPMEYVPDRFKDTLKFEQQFYLGSVEEIHRNRIPVSNSNGHDHSSFSRRAGQFANRTNPPEFEDSSKFPTSSLFFRRLSDITSNYSGIHTSHSSNVVEQRNTDYFAEFVRPFRFEQASFPFNRDSATSPFQPSAGTLSRETVGRGADQQARRQGEEFTLGPNALEESIYDLHATYPSSRNLDTTEERHRAEARSGWHVDGAFKEREDHVEASFFMVV